MLHNNFLIISTVGTLFYFCKYLSSITNIVNVSDLFMMYSKNSLPLLIYYNWIKWDSVLVPEYLIVIRVPEYQTCLDFVK